MKKGMSGSSGSKNAMIHDEHVMRQARRQFFTSSASGLGGIALFSLLAEDGLLGLVGFQEGTRQIRFALERHILLPVPSPVFFFSWPGPQVMSISMTPSQSCRNATDSRFQSPLPTRCVSLLSRKNQPS